MKFPSFSHKPQHELIANKEKILVVDDDQAHRTCLKDFLELRGYTCLEAENGVHALQILGKESVDMIITDNQMPLMNGLDFIEHVNQESNGEVLPIFLMTAELSYPVRLRAFKNGVNRVFEKPLDFQELCHAVDWVTKFDLPATATMRCASQG
ncbi:MAG: response regulator [Nitrospira sp.]|nr:response regulator [Nitrospira sp.]MCB9710546.1 response regulator [Nitrospiraceae bacterium]MDR4486978.1 response regulator [Nitrospirales bacterium]MCA9465666.1 response regulator [Nitrospira sp.]MCA9474898.1 response regulator [Nitrospira sp.]